MEQESAPLFTETAEQTNTARTETDTREAEREASESENVSEMTSGRGDRQATRDGRVTRRLSV